MLTGDQEFSERTELEVGIAGTDMITSTENTFHHQGYSQRIVQSKVLWYTIVL